jgi:hypothetical protein
MVLKFVSGNMSARIHSEPFCFWRYHRKALIEAEERESCFLAISLERPFHLMIELVAALCLQHHFYRSSQLGLVELEASATVYC